MANVAVYGRDLTTNQGRTLRPGDDITDDTGTPLIPDVSDLEFGTGALGVGTISSTTTTAGDLNYTDLTINSSVSLNATARRKLTVRCTGDLTLNAGSSIHADGRGEAGLAGGGANNPTGDAGGSSISAAPGTGTGPGTGGGGGGGGGDGPNFWAGGDGGDGGLRAPHAGVGLSAALAGSGGTGGNTGGGNGASGTGDSTTPTARMQDDRGSVGNALLWGSAGGAGGGGGGAGVSTPGSPGSQTGSGVGDGGAGVDSAGGASGAGGGNLDVWVGGSVSVDATARLSADGGDGGDGGGDTGGNTTGGGGGGGGAGGVVRLMYVSTSTPGNIDAAHIHAVGGSGSAGGTAAQGNGGAGAAGEDGLAVFVQV